MSKESGDKQDKLLDWLSTKFLAWMSKEVPAVIKWVWVTKERNPQMSDQELAAIAIKQASRWSGRVGFVAGLGDLLGPIGFGAGTVVDVWYGAKLAVEMGMRIYSIYGHDLHDDEVKLRLLVALGGGGAALGKTSGKGATKVGGRLVKLYLRGPLLEAIRVFFRKLGVVFTKTGLLKAMPVFGSVVNAGVNKVFMNATGKDILQDVEHGEKASG